MSWLCNGFVGMIRRVIDEKVSHEDIKIVKKLLSDLGVDMEKEDVAGITGPKQPGDNMSRNGRDNVNPSGNNQSGSRGKQTIPVTTNKTIQESANISLTNEHRHSTRQSGAGSGDPEAESSIQGTM